MAGTPPAPPGRICILTLTLWGLCWSLQRGWEAGLLVSVLSDSTCCGKGPDSSPGLSIKTSIPHFSAFTHKYITPLPTHFTLTETWDIFIRTTASACGRGGIGEALRCLFCLPVYVALVANSGIYGLFLLGAEGDRKAVGEPRHPCQRSESSFHIDVFLPLRVIGGVLHHLQQVA